MGLIEYFGSLDPVKLLGNLPGGIGQGLIWGMMALGVYITFRLLDFADLSVDGTFATGGAVTVMLLLAADTEFVLGMVKKPAIEQLVREKAAAVLGRAVQVRFVLKTQLGSSGADPLDRLVAFGKEHSDIFTIK